MKRSIIVIFISFIFYFSSFSQQKEISYKTDVFSSFSDGENTPFWMLHHNWGMVPLDANNFYLRGAIFYDQEINKDWSCRLGFDLAGSSPHSYGTPWIQQAYGELDWKMFRLRIGSKEDYSSQLDERLSSGDFNQSNHARPIPEVKLSSDYLIVPYMKENMYIRGDFALGKYLDGQWQEDKARSHNQPYTKDVLSHHKSIYFRFGNIEKRNKRQFTVGFDHFAQWGGLLYKYRWIDGNYRYIEENQPQGISDLFRVMIAKEGNNASAADNAYVSGSQTGSYLLKFDYRLKNADQLNWYFQHFFDDGSGMNPASFRDMLMGIQYKLAKKRLLSNVLFEYVYTKEQTGPIHFNLEMDDAHDNLRDKGIGNDDYYNNTDYVQGPSHYGRTMGTSLFLSPEHNKNGQVNFKSNRIIAFHLGVEGYFSPNLSYRFLATTGQTWGRFYVPFIAVKDGFASNLDLRYDYPKAKGLNIKLSAGFNTGSFFGENAFGGGITITKQGKFFKLIN